MEIFTHIFKNGLRIKYTIKSNGCWIPVNRLPNHDRYIRVHYGHNMFYLHKLSFCEANGLDYDDKSFQANHKPECHNPMCFNAEHIYAGTHLDNMSDRTNRIIHCPSGHEYNEKNRKHPKGCRLCLKAMNERNRLKRIKQKEINAKT